MYQNCILIFNGAIGEFLMFLSLADVVNERNKKVKFFVLCNTNERLLKELALPYTNVYVYRKNSLKSFLDVFLKNLNKKSFIVTFMNFGSEVKSLLIYKKILSILTTSDIYTFKDVHDVKNNFYYDHNKTFFENITKLGKLLDVEISPNPPKFKFTKDESLMQNLGLKKEIYIVVHMFATNKGRSLPEKRWLEILREITTKYPDTKVVLTGGPADAEEISKYLINGNILDTTTSPSITSTINMIDNCKIFIGVDTGVTHLASLLKKDVVVIGNFSNPTWLPTYNPKSIILGHKENCTCDGKKGGECKIEENGIKYYRCMFEIENIEIMNEIEKLWL